GDIVAATSKSGWVFLCSATIPPVIERKETSYAFSNALCFWQKDGGGQYLLIGIRGSAYTNGYRELDLRQEDGVWKLGACTSPVASVESSAKYASTLGIHALTSIIQAPGSIAANGYPLVFASTQQHGLWSYRGVWNAEE
ncbi:MAG: hypothetical protein LBC72_04765, partial [Spirochaetaceae bacterium]|nr:hypothetical protein [Spirochaetaceae bacterium]